MHKVLPKHHQEACYACELSSLNVQWFFQIISDLSSIWQIIEGYYKLKLKQSVISYLYWIQFLLKIIKRHQDNIEAYDVQLRTIRGTPLGPKIEKIPKAKVWKFFIWQIFLNMYWLIFLHKIGFHNLKFSLKRQWLNHWVT